MSDEKPRVYIETTIPSYLTAWPSGNVIRAAHQQMTRTWWSARASFQLYVSQLVVMECRGGDPAAAADRLAALVDIAELDETSRCDELAKELQRAIGLPPKAAADSRHIAMAAVHGMRYLLTWNCTHIANVAFRAAIDSVCRNAGCEPPSICTPEELLLKVKHK